MQARMQAWQYRQHGEPSHVLQKEEREIPIPNAHQVQIKVKCAALNPIGNKSMTSFPSFMVKKPAIAEMDVSGIVTAVGGSVASFKVGEEVYGIIPGEVEMKTGIGALAQYTVVSEQHLVHKPENISWQEAAATPLAALTAYETLVTIGGLKAGQHVFVNGGSGGVGTFGIQIAKALGARVAASCSDKNLEFVKSIGADEAIDYKAHDLPHYLREKFSEKANRFDVVMDTVGSTPLFRHSNPYLNSSGIYVQVGAPMGSIVENMRMGFAAATNYILPAFLGNSSRRYKFMMLSATKDKLEAINELIKQGKVRPVIDSTYEFDDVHAAYERIMSHRARGKVVVNVDSNK